MIKHRIAIAACLFIAACGGEQDNLPPEGTPYKDMSFEERHAFMTVVVLPKMTETFVAFDAKFEGMSCTTCHGSGADKGIYTMPNKELPVLPNSEAAFAEYVKDPEHARWSQFMIDKVYPQMADLLKEPLFDPMTNPTGFSCHNCHTVVGEN